MKVVNDLCFIQIYDLYRLSRAPVEIHHEPSQSDDYSYSSDLVMDTKRRLKNLEREAEVRVNTFVIILSTT